MSTPSSVKDSRYADQVAVRPSATNDRTQPFPAIHFAPLQGLTRVIGEVMQSKTKVTTRARAKYSWNALARRPQRLPTHMHRSPIE